MKKGKQKNRRQFLRNTSLAALSLGILPAISKGEVIEKSTKKDLAVCDKTTRDFYGEGPFYTDNPPTINGTQLADQNEVGERMIISGRVFNLDCSQYIPETVVDVWHTDNEGDYDNAGFNLRGKTLSNAQGFYMYETIKPGKYLNGGSFRPAHIHYKVTPPGFDTLITQLYFAGDSDIPGDSAASITSGEFDATHRIINLTANTDGKLEGTFDIVINGSGVTGLNDIHIDKGMLYKISPNPFSDHLVIKYGVFKKAKVSLLVYDLMGKLVANLEERVLSPEKYEAEWRPEDSLPNGHYFIALKVNELQVHYMKVIRQK
ncbi:MAG: protocatechuate 3,4-dioxygenase beta subunit [Gammaproteobacteria bacterium]|jgi:protocatechuate 3,4-dioxygenase beta subunit